MGITILSSREMNQDIGRAKKAAQDTTDSLLASPANAERLRQAYEQFDRGEKIDFSLPAE